MGGVKKAGVEKAGPRGFKCGACRTCQNPKWKKRCLEAPPSKASSASAPRDARAEGFRDGAAAVDVGQVDDIGRRVAGDAHEVDRVKSDTDDARDARDAPSESD